MANSVIKGMSRTSVGQCNFFKSPDGFVSMVGLCTLPMTIPEEYRVKSVNSFFAPVVGYGGSSNGYFLIASSGAVRFGDSALETGQYFISCTYK